MIRPENLAELKREAESLREQEKQHEVEYARLYDAYQGERSKAGSCGDQAALLERVLAEFTTIENAPPEQPDPVPFGPDTALR